MGKLFEANSNIAIEIKLEPQSSHLFIRSTLKEHGNTVAKVFLGGIVKKIEIGHELDVTLEE